MKKLLALLLAASMLVPMTSCASDNNVNSDTEPGESAASAEITDTSAETAAETEDENAYLYEDLPTKDFGGKEFNMLHYIEEGWVVTLHSEEMTGEPVNDALYEHSLAVEDKLNININLYSTGLGEVDNIVNTTVASGDNAYDVFWQYLESSSNQVLKGNCLSLDQADALNFSKPWWKKSLIDDISIGDKVYMAFGDITLYTYECMTVMTFNKRIVDMFQKADPYELVDSDEWTFDAFTTMIDGVKQDVDGNGVYGEDLVDLFALGAFPSQSYEAFFVNQGLGIIEKDENNLPVYNGISENYYDFYQKVAEFAKDKERVCFNANFSPNFAAGLQMFFAGPIFYLGRNFRDMEDDFGLVPYPKADDKQSKYYGTVTTQLQPVCIPVSNPDPSGTSIVLENLAAESLKSVRNVYYNTLLEYKYVRDEKSIEMLDLIYNSDVRIGLHTVYNWGSINSTLTNSLREGSENIVSTIKRSDKLINKMMEKTIEEVTSSGK